MTSESPESKMIFETAQEENPQNNQQEQAHNTNDLPAGFSAKITKAVASKHPQKFPGSLWATKSQSSSPHQSGTFGWGDESGSSYFWLGDKYDGDCEATEEETEFGESLRSLVSLAIAEARERASATRSTRKAATASEFQENLRTQEEQAAPKNEIQWDELVGFLEHANLEELEHSISRKESKESAETVSSVLRNIGISEGLCSRVLGPLAEVSGHSTSFTDTNSEHGEWPKQDSEEVSCHSEEESVCSVRPPSSPLKDEDACSLSHGPESLSSASSHHGKVTESNCEPGDELDNPRKTHTRSADYLSLTKSMSTKSNQVELDSNEGEYIHQESSEEEEEVVSLTLSQALEFVESGEEESTDEEPDMESSFSLEFDALSVTSTVTWMDDNEFAWEEDLVDISMEEKLYQSFSTENAQSPVKTDSARVSKTPPRPLCPALEEHGGIHITVLEGASLDSFSSLPHIPCARAAARRNAYVLDSFSSSYPGSFPGEEMDSLDYHRKHTRGRERLALPGDEIDSLVCHRLHVQSRFRNKNEHARNYISSLRRTRWSVGRPRRRPNKRLSAASAS